MGVVIAWGAAAELAAERPVAVAEEIEPAGGADFGCAGRERGDRACNRDRGR